jgi:predicted PurR-regulated permease PerM
MGAGLILLVLFGVTLFGIFKFSDPASRWLESAPEYARQAEYKLRGIKESVDKIGEAGAAVEGLTRKKEEEVQEVDIQQETISDTLLDHTQQFLASNLVALILLYFLLASGSTFLRKLVHMVPEYRHRRAVVRIFRSTEQSLSTYLITFTAINLVLGGAVSTAFYFLGMPSPILWGVVAAVLNFIPYIGSLIGVVIMALIAIVTYETIGEALVPPIVYLLLTGVEGNFLRPMILGRWLTLNPVAIFIALVFWGWIWGIAGAVLAVPMLMSFKIVCDNISVLNPIGIILGR